MLVTPTPEKNLGTVVMSSVQKFQFEIRSTGQYAVTPTLTFGCGACTSGFFEKPNIKPGESSILNITFKPNSKGFNKKNVKVNYTYQGGTPQLLSLSFTANVI